MRADDLTNLFTFGGAADVGFHQGTVTAWNASTGANTISVAGAILTDVPILNTGEAIALKPGHVVGLLRFKSTYFVLGRITIPGNPDFAAASVAFDGVTNLANNYGLTTSYADIVTGTLDVPSWVDEAVVICTVDASVINPTASLDAVGIRASIGGVVGGANLKVVEANGATASDQAVISASYQRVISSPGSTITVAAQMSSGVANWSANAANIVSVNAIAVYRSVT